MLDPEPRIVDNHHVSESERKRIDEQLRLACKAFEHIVDGLIIADEQRRIISVNQAFTETTGYSAGEVIGKSPRFLQSGRHDAAFYAQMWQTIDTHGGWRGEVWDRRKNGEIYPELLSISAVRDGAGTITHYVGIFNDISNLKEHEARLRYLAHHDALTELPNRSLFQDRVVDAMQRARRNNTVVAVFFLDLDHFKNINDTVGHAGGDTLLKGVASRLTETVREIDVVARFGGDEFAVMLDGLNEASDAEVVAQKLLDVMARPFLIGDREFNVSASIGISCYPTDGADISTLLKNADSAMYWAKNQGRNTYRLFSLKQGLVENTPDPEP
jgi:diguanylate cyclase (GGDEF)-like protein/PAS domain S-box-containing protein